jgi:hypothetical protein
MLEGRGELGGGGKGKEGTGRGLVKKTSLR